MSARRIKIMKCENRHYSLRENCPECGGKTFNPEPPKFSPSDKYGSQRRKILYK